MLYHTPNWTRRSVEQDTGSDLPPFPQRVSGPLNLFKGFGVSWSISVQDNKEIHAGLILRAKTNNVSTIERNPLSILHAFRDTLLVENCSHDRRDPLTSEDDFAHKSCLSAQKGPKPVAMRTENRTL